MIQRPGKNLQELDRVSKIHTESSSGKSDFGNPKSELAPQLKDRHHGVRLLGDLRLRWVLTN